jgi:hypothetical protein
MNSSSVTLETYLISTSKAPTRNVETLGRIGPLDAPVGGQGEVLRRVARTGCARPDLHLNAIGGVPPLTSGKMNVSQLWLQE